MSYKHGRLIPVMGNGDESAKVNTSTDLLAYCSFPTGITARSEISLRMVATKANANSADYKLLIRKDGNTALSTEQEFQVDVSQRFNEPAVFEAVILANSDLLGHAAGGSSDRGSSYGWEMRQTIASGAYGHYIWSPILEVRLR